MNRAMAASKRSYAFNIHSQRESARIRPKKKTLKSTTGSDECNARKRKNVGLVGRRLRRKVCAMGEGISAGQ